MSVSRPRSISMSSAVRSSQKGRRPSFLNDTGEVRLVENGFDLTPLPLLVDEAPPDEVEEAVAEREVEFHGSSHDGQGMGMGGLCYVFTASTANPSGLAKQA